MKRSWLGIAAGLIGLGLLSGVSAGVTVRYLYSAPPEGAPTPPAAALAGTGRGPATAGSSGSGKTGPTQGAQPTPGAVTAPGTSPSPSDANSVAPATPGAPSGAVSTSGGSTAPATPPKPAAPLPEGTNLTAGALSVVGSLPTVGEFLPTLQRATLSKLAPRPLRASLLPGSTDQTGSVLVWTSYSRPDGTTGSGPLLVQFQSGRPTSITGPLVPVGGYTRPELDLRDEKGRSLPASATRSKPLLLIAPRRPETGLGYTLTSLQATLAPHGVTVALVIDIGAPDWIATARKEGFAGPIWRSKSQLDRVPVVTPGQLEGAVGLMIDKDGDAVGSLPLLNPTAYDLFDREPAQIAVQVLQAWGLIPE